MPECDNPLWPCAMTGAAACLAGIDGIAVVIHGSSGCYYYPTTLLHAPLHGTFILEDDVIFGSEDRLQEVIGSLSGTGKRIAVITTCVPALLGEDIRSMLEDHDVILVDSPGFAGDVETGYARALAMLEPGVDPETYGVNSEGACLFDPFAAGNVQEVRRLLGMAAVPVATVFSSDVLDRMYHAAPFTIGTNADFPSGVGENLGGMLGLTCIRETFTRISDTVDGACCDRVFSELEIQEERLVRACDKYLQRYDPPSAAIFAGSSYAIFAADALHTYLDAEICCIGTRNAPGDSGFRIEEASSLSRVRELIAAHDPDIVIGSSFERSLCKEKAFTGIIPPLRGRVRIYPAPLAGINGTLSFMESVLNSCMDKKTLIGSPLFSTFRRCFTFTPRTPGGYISPGSTPIYDRRWSCMMEKAGYLQATRSQAVDGDGAPHGIVELHILGNRYAIRRSDLIRAVTGRVHVQVEDLTRNWGDFLGQTRGLAQVSASGRALNIDIFGQGNYTLSLSSLKAVLYGKERLAVIVRIPEAPLARIRRAAEGQQTIGAVV
ncbi:MAG TPA: nitrogenase component 1 [Methanoregula sp.]|nr:nitrogenase component 1 [Methanoregula sp.]